jgi:hypothetical protein
MAVQVAPILQLQEVSVGMSSGFCSAACWVLLMLLPEGFACVVWEHQLRKLCLFVEAV